MGFFDKLKSGLKKTKESFLGTVDTILAGFGKIDEALFEELEDVLISSDFGVQTTEEILKKLRESVKTKKLTEASQIRSELQEIIAGLLDIGARGLDLDDVPAVITVIGVNGVGKTTSIGKIAHLYRNAGKKVLLAAGDTFRAAAGGMLVACARGARRLDACHRHHGQCSMGEAGGKLLLKRYIWEVAQFYDREYAGISRYVNRIERAH